ncbi:TlyA family RNA methyltransferase [Robiginitomaculum antarcticum]|uniref:TlyA family RNA methyltransferase n=1 Tax=Robiginitomaculum antarcticum TaxID=437507 RepID=UPI000363B671|nr:TlyA family RNA methyltransferase [Robiginitomaculum antarcticum]
MPRLDQALVQRGLLETRSAAQAAIKSGGVTVNGKPVRKSAHKVSDTDVISAKPAHPYVSRAALKLEKALDVFGVDPSGQTCLDIGSSTGGFSQLLILRGAAKIFAIDVGTDQLHYALRAEPKIALLEQQDARTLTAAHIPARIDLVVCDASFISLTKILPVPLTFLKPRGEAILLVKPQFELGPDALNKNGVVKDTERAEDAPRLIAAWMTDQGFVVKGQTKSPIRGGSGNSEFLVYAVKL